ncbi:unnamed protein product [Paramecium sonneborni]|uniref:DUF4378 domain-containing protein n=1 Tax=Paramecium sonneborni TaxID=65129 RepID=A0A8S1K852_9CILI|nr:unnamed protein product [Paramecium sonneborni]
MNTYSSVKSIESQIFGRRIQEPNVAVMHSKHQPNPKHHSPESFLDQYVNLKLVEPQKILQKQKPIQGLQGKGTVNNVQFLKPAQSSNSVKKQTKRTISPKKKKTQTVDTVQMTKPKSQQQRREQMGLGELNEKQIKQRIKKIKSKEKNVEQLSLKKKPYEPNIRLQNYITQKKTIINNNYIQQQLMFEMEKQRKLENLAQLNQSVKDIFKKCKTQENCNMQPQKAFIKKKKVDIQKENSQQNSRQVRNQNKSKKLQQKFDDISQRYQQIQNVRNNDYQNIDQCIFEMDEEDDKYSAVSENQMIQQALQTLQIIKPTKYLINQVKQIIENQDNIDLDLITEQDYQVIQYHFMNQAATKLQSLWRGVNTRKQILSELQQMMDDEYQNRSDEDPSQIYQKRHFQKEFIGDITNSVPKGSFELNASFSNKIDNQSIQELNLNQDEYSINEQSKQNLYFKEEQIFDNKLSDQISEPIMIQQPNSPIEQFQQFSIQFGQSDEKKNLELIETFVQNEDEKTNSLSQSVIQQIQQELESWNSQIDSIFQQSNDNDCKVISKVKQQISQTVIKIVNSHLKKSREVKYLNESSNEEKIRNLYEANNEKHFNDTIKRLKQSKELSAEQLLYSSREFDQKRHILTLESQLKLKETELLNMREEAINLRYFSELKKIKSDINKKQELDQWLEKEKEDLRSTKQLIEISRIREAQTIQKIQRDLQIASIIDENNPKIQNFKKFIDEQFLENSSIINETKIIQNQIQQQENEDKDKNLENQDIEEVLNFNENQIQTYHHTNFITTCILDQLINNLSQELFRNQTEFQIVMINLTKQYSNSQSITSIQYIKEYIQNLFDFIMVNYSDDLIKNLTIPFGFRSLKRIQLIHGYDVENENQDQQISEIAFPIDQVIFAKFEQYRVELNNKENYQQINQGYQFENIHNKAIFDACNEALNYQRPYYLNQGQPYPWEKLENQVIIKKDFLPKIFSNTENKIIKWSKTLGGFLPIDNLNQISIEKQEILEEKNSQLMINYLNREKKIVLDIQQQEQIQENIISIRDERIYKLLIQDIKESEFKWYLIEDDRTELLMELSDSIFEFLVEEIVSEQLEQ